MKPPKKTDVLIFDTTGSQLLIDLILPEIDYSVLPVRSEKYYLCPQIALKIIKNIDYSDLIHSRNIKRHIFRSYLISCLEFINPKIVLTFIDNSPIFQWISRNYHGAEFFAIQNGLRNKYDLETSLENSDKSITRMTMPNFLCFGKCDVDNYKKYGHTIEIPHCVGSFKGSYYKYGMKKGAVKKEFDLCLVSQYRSEIFRAKEFSQFREASMKVHSFLNSYLEKKPLRACIACRFSDPDEFEYYKAIFGNKVSIIQQTAQNIFSTYEAMDSSDVIITLNSTAALDAFGWGKKVLFCNFSGDEIAEFFFRGPCSVQKMEFNEFENALRSLQEMKYEDFLSLTEKDRHYMMNYDPNMPVNEYMRNIIIKTLKKK